MDSIVAAAKALAEKAGNAKQLEINSLILKAKNLETSFDTIKSLVDLPENLVSEYEDYIDVAMKNIEDANNRYITLISILVKEKQISYRPSPVFGMEELKRRFSDGQHYISNEIRENGEHASVYLNGNKIGEVDAWEIHRDNEGNITFGKNSAMQTVKAEDIIAIGIAYGFSIVMKNGDFIEINVQQR